MNILLTTLNSKYIHSNLALRDLKAYCGPEHANIRLLEFTINDQYERIIAGLVSQKPDLLCFSCYIWNIRQTLDVISSVKEVLPHCRVLLGGPEVSYDGEELMAECPNVDYIVVGEGEETFRELLGCLTSACSFSEDGLSGIKGLIWRKDSGRIQHNGARGLISLDSVPFVYESGLQELSDRIMYYETSRGCPYQCQYCLSSTTGRVRFLSMDRVKKELAFFVRSGVRQVKLVDRTFNCNSARAGEIFQYIIDLGGKTNFHMEMAGDLIDEAALGILSKAPAGMFQFEIGVQSTRESTLHAIKRKTDLSRVKHAVARILSMDNIHVHLDLIAGLPEEDMNSMARSFNEVLELRPHRLQLGFLKLLKGSGLRDSAQEYGCHYTKYPPYEILFNNVLSFEDLTRLKRIEELTELYYNSHRFDRAVDYLFRQAHGDCFRILNDMAVYWQEHGYFHISHSNMRLYEILVQYAESLDCIDMELFRDLLRFDYVRHEKPNRYPIGLEPDANEDVIDRIHSYLRINENVKQILPDLTGQSPKQILKIVHAEVFRHRLDLNGEGAVQREQTAVLFDYRHPTGILGKAKMMRINI
jgi:radical SAM superfamily enzyme YgiQ (UPF0313 family)